MNIYHTAVVLVVLSVSHHVFCFEQAGRCIKYGKDEVSPDIIGGERFCLKEDDFTYCREWACSPKCSNFEKWPGVCEACTGVNISTLEEIQFDHFSVTTCTHTSAESNTCTEGGILIETGKDFKCIDNANNCRCAKNGKIIRTRKNQSVKEMCFDKKRIAKKP